MNRNRRLPLIAKIAAVVVFVLVLLSVGYITSRVFGGYTASVEQNLHAAVAGECFRVNYLRWQIDRESYAHWQQDQLTIRLTQQALKNEPQALRTTHHNPKNANVQRDRQALNVQRALIHRIKQSATTEHFLPLTDCSLAINHPLTYRPPAQMSFGHLTALQRHELQHAPRVDP